MGNLLDRCNFPPRGSLVDCAVSGGPDSLALLVLALESGLQVTAWHVDHGLRDSSSDEGQMVSAVAAKFGAEVRLVDASISDGPNLEERARQARISVLPKGILTGHTADDQAETVLINLLRGSGVPGTAGIGETYRRPLLALRRFETQRVCQERGLEPVCDPMNFEPRFVRNRIRHEVLPLLADISGRDPVILLARHAERAAEAVGLLADLAVDIDVSDTRSVSNLPDDLVRLAIRSWLMERASVPPDTGAIDRVLDVVRGKIWQQK